MDCRANASEGGLAAEGVVAASQERPDFKPMVQWFSGTSADMYCTMFGLIISVKVFLGRFDMRTMQVPSSNLYIRTPQDFYKK